MNDVSVDSMAISVVDDKVFDDELINEREDRVNCPDVVLLTNTPPAETVNFIVDSSTFDDPLTVNA